MASDLCEVFHFTDIPLVYTHFLISSYFGQWPFANTMVTNGHLKKNHFLTNVYIYNQILRA